MGNPLDEKTDIGTVISKQQHQKISSYIEKGFKKKNKKKKKIKIKK
jgi:acyl-CoA reductase-like NAD-dependent aldehyde dehydrogenase